MPISLRLPVETEARLNFLASQTGRSKSYYLREIIENGLDEMEEYYLAEEVLTRIKQGKEAIVSAEKMRKNLGLEN